MSPALASDNNSILINEICPFSDPSCEGGEWIELSNQSDNDVILAGYTIEDENIEKDYGTSDYKPTLLDSFSISSHGLLLLKKINGDFSFGINDSDEKIVLRENEEVVDQFSYGTIGGINQLYSNPTKGRSYSFFETSGWKQSVPTPGEVNNIPGDDTDLNNIVPIDISKARELENGDGVTVTGIVTTLPGGLSSQYFYLQDKTEGIQVHC